MAFYTPDGSIRKDAVTGRDVKPANFNLKFALGIFFSLSAKLYFN